MSARIKGRIAELLGDFHDGRIEADELVKQCLRLGAKWRYGWQQDIAAGTVDDYVVAEHHDDCGRGFRGGDRA